MTPKKEKILLFTLATIQFTAILDFMIVMPLGPQLMRIFEINPSQFGIIVSSYTFAAGFTGLVGAFFIDRFDRKTALMIASNNNYFGMVKLLLGNGANPNIRDIKGFGAYHFSSSVEIKALLEMRGDVLQEEDEAKRKKRHMQR